MVATVVELRSSAMAVTYYERDGYYAKNDAEHRQASFWYGDAAKALGLKAHVRPSRFTSVLSGYVPGTELRLGRMREGEHEHRPGWDITLSAPKSVSLEALVMGDRRVIRAHDEAVRATLGFVETELLQTRGWDPATRRRPRVKAEGMVVAGFRHLASRDQDPQLHTHCVLANMTRTASGEWRSVEPTRIRRSQKLIGAYYRNELAQRLQALGMAVSPTLVGRVPGFELAGYDRSFLDAFSGRRREILAYLERQDLSYTARHTQMAALHTRRRKEDRTLADLVPEWRARAQALGLVREREALRPPRPLDPLTGERAGVPHVPPPDLSANEIRSQKRAPALPKLPRQPRAGVAELAGAHPTGARSPAPAELSQEPERGVLEAVARAVAHVAERRTAIPEAEIRAVALGHAPGRYTLAQVDTAIARLVRDGELIEAERRGMDRAFVTDRAVKAERQVLASMRAGRGKGMALAGADAVEARLGASRLTQGQREAVRAVLLSKDLVIGVQGHAGSGKTTMLSEAKELLGDRTIQGLAPSAAAARVLAREAGIPTRTLQYFLTRFGDLSDPARLARGRDEYAGTVLAVDEASMIDTVRADALLRIARELEVARVALVGDTAQLKAVDAGQPFRLLQKAGMATATMDEVLRQRDPELRATVGLTREGEPGAAIAVLGHRVREAPREELGIEAARRWLALAPEQRADTLLLAPTHAIRRQANDAVREGLAEEGVLRGRTLAVDRLVDRRLTRAQASEIGSYEPGDLAVFHRDHYGCRRDDVCTVTGIEEGRVVLAHPDDGERRFRPSGNAAWYLRICDTERIELRAGDRVRWTRNRAAPPARFGHPRAPDLVNGGEAEIVEIGYKRVRFRDGEGREFNLALKDPQLRHLDHAYCSTVHAAQGRTARAAIAVLDADGWVDRELFHVELSRVSESFLLLTDDRDALVERLKAPELGDDGALEALGIDLSEPPVVDPEVFAALAADWRALLREGEETNTVPFYGTSVYGTSVFLAGYRDVMARAAALAQIEDLPQDMRLLTDTMLAEHEGHLARDREVRGLVEGIRDHWRRWPELGWAASAQGVPTEKLPAYDAWREEGAALLEAGRSLLEVEGVAARHLTAMPGGRAGLEEAVGMLERTRLLDDAARFERAWHALRERAAETGVPELYAPGHRQVAALGERLVAAEGLDEHVGRMVAEWREADTAQAALAEEVRALPGRVAAWRERHADLTQDDPGGLDPARPARQSWREEGAALEAVAGDMLRPEDARKPYLDAEPGSREAVRQAAEEVGDALRDDRYRAFGWLTEEVVRQARETRTEAFHVPRYRETVAEAEALSGQAALPARTQELVASWLDYHARCQKICRQIEDTRMRVDALTADCPERPATLDALTDWRQRAEPLLGEARAMLADDAPHARHLAAMPDERAALAEGAGRLDRTLLTVEAREMTVLSTVADRWAE
ncbi:MAG: relaxase domain-containing protein, partial [Bryobacterales bacterium]|nr:relaxase domain-containing protein [Bryobacterales bacterium]